MKKLVIILGAGMFIGMAVWLISSKTTSQRRADSAAAGRAETNRLGSLKAAPTLPSPALPNARQPLTNLPQTAAQAPTNPMTRTEWEQRMNALILQGLQQTQWEWKMPIEFYGKVVDQDGNPVSGVRAHLIWTDISDAGTSETILVSDADGRFSLSGVQGKALSVYVSKEGYYTSKRQNATSFEYAREYEWNYHRPDPNHPVLFHLRKRGSGTELVTSQYGVRRTLGVRVPLDGAPVYVDPLTRTVGPTGPLQISQHKPALEQWKAATEWSFRLAIPDGGFVEHDDEFPFEAPEDGYRPVVEFHFRKGETNWTDLLRKQYYIAFGQPRKYGRMVVETSIDMEGARLEYAINPDGARYLEPRE